MYRDDKPSREVGEAGKTLPSTNIDIRSEDIHKSPPLATHPYTLPAGELSFRICAISDVTIMSSNMSKVFQLSMNGRKSSKKEFVPGRLLYLTVSSKFPGIVSDARVRVELNLWADTPTLE